MRILIMKLYLEFSISFLSLRKFLVFNSMKSMKIKGKITESEEMELKEYQNLKISLKIMTN